MFFWDDYVPSKAYGYVRDQDADVVVDPNKVLAAGSPEAPCVGGRDDFLIQFL